MRIIILLSLIVLVGCAPAPKPTPPPVEITPPVWKTRVHILPDWEAVRTFLHVETGLCLVRTSYDGGLVEVPTAVCED